MPLPAPDPLLLALDMGYGHLRAAWALSEALDVPVGRIDAPPLASPREVRIWDRTRLVYELCSRHYRTPVAGLLPRRFLDAMTSIRPRTPRGQSPAPTRAVRFQAKLIRQGMGREIVRRLRATGGRMLTTFYTPGLVADYAGLDRAYVVVTDADVHRVWAPLRPAATRIHYLVPSPRAHERLRSYGVPASRLTMTGFPLPLSLVGDETGDVLRKNLAARLRRLHADPALLREVARDGRVPVPRYASPAPPHVVFAIGGAGAQTEIVHRMLVHVHDVVAAGRLRLTLVAGTRPDVAEAFRRDVARAGLGGQPGVRILHEPDFDSYWRAVNQTYATADVLWTKPSEMVFYAGLGLPLILAPHVGSHERYNPVWPTSVGAAVPQGPPEEAARWLMPLLENGTLARAAWQGFLHLPHQGTRRIVETIGGAVRSGRRAAEAARVAS